MELLIFVWLLLYKSKNRPPIPTWRRISITEPTIKWKQSKTNVRKRKSFVVQNIPQGSPNELSLEKDSLDGVWWASNPAQTTVERVDMRPPAWKFRNWSLIGKIYLTDEVSICSEVDTFRRNLMGLGGGGIILR